jgi:hypothetical protein
MIENIGFDGFGYYNLSRRSLRRVFILGQLHMKRKWDGVFILDDGLLAEESSKERG